MTAAPESDDVRDVLAVRDLDVTVGGRKLIDSVDFTIRAA